MNPPKLHSPYVEKSAVGASRPFAIGLSPLDRAEWIEIDDLLGPYLDEKQRLTELVPDKVLVAEPGSEPGQEEVLTLLVSHLLARFPEIYRSDGAEIEIVPAHRRVLLDQTATSKLAIAASLVQEDLVLMRKGVDGWRLAAGSLSFPSSWRLLEKFGKPMADIHAPVPGFGPGSRNASLIERMFDMLRPEQPMVRWNWGMHEDGALYHPVSGPDLRQFGDESDFFIRVERQTLTKLAVSGDILFTIRIHLNPLSVLARQPNRGVLAKGLAQQITAMSDAELDYKGLADGRGRVLARLSALAD